MSSRLLDTSCFRSFEHDGWQSAAHRYHEAFGELTGQSVTALLDAVGAGRGMRLLDVASGPGYVAAAAAERGAEVVGIDFSAAMVAQARQKYPDIEFREGDAEALPFPDRRFEAVVMNYGLLHLGQPEQALAEIHRVLRSSGRVGFTVWSKPEEAIGFEIVLRAIEAHGSLDVALPPAPPFFRFSDPQECYRSLLEAGFVSPHVTRIPQIWRLRSPEALFEIMREATVRTAGLLRAQSKEILDAIRSAVREASLNYLRGDMIELPMPAVLASAVKP